MGSCSKKFRSSMSMNRLAYEGATLVPMAVPWICLYIFELNSK